MKFVTYDEYVSEAIEADSREAAEHIAESFWRDGDWDVSTGCVWVEYHLAESDEDGEAKDGTDDRYTITIEQPEPECTDEESGHDWQSPHSIVGGIESNPGVWGNGGGVIINECCMKCGCQKKTNTWAQNPADGTQGHTVTSYSEGEYELPTKAESFGRGMSVAELMATLDESEAESTQDWDEGTTTWSFDDGSEIIIEGMEVTRS